MSHFKRYACPIAIQSIFKIKADAAAVGSEYLKYLMFNTNRPFQWKASSFLATEKSAKKKKGHILGDEKISIYLRGVDYNVTLAS